MIRRHDTRPIGIYFRLLMLTCFCSLVSHGGSKLVEIGPLPRSLDYPASRIEFVNDFDGWAMGERLWSTHDGGKSWQSVPLPRPSLLAAHLDTVDSGWIVASKPSESGALYETTDGARTWILKGPVPDFDVINFAAGGRSGWRA